MKIIQKLTILEANDEIRIQLINKEGKHFLSNASQQKVLGKHGFPKEMRSC